MKCSPISVRLRINSLLRSQISTALILLVVTDGSSSSFVGFSLLELVCVFSKYELLHCAFFVSFALFHVSYLKIACLPKLVERLDQSPIFYLFLFIKRYLFLYNKRRQHKLRPSTLRHYTSRPGTTPLNMWHMYAKVWAVHVLIVQLILLPLISLPPKAKLSKMTIPMAILKVIPHLSRGWLLAHSLMGMVHSLWLFGFRKGILRYVR